MSTHSEAVAALKKATKVLMEARTYAKQMEDRMSKAQEEERTALINYNTVLSNLRANLELEIVQEMDDREFQRSGVVNDAISR